MPSGATARCATSSGSTSWRAASGSPSAACSRCRSPSTTPTATSSSARSKNSPRPAPRCSKGSARGEPRAPHGKGPAATPAAQRRLLLLEFDAEFANHGILAAPYVRDDSALPPHVFEAGVNKRDRAPDQIDVGRHQLLVR